MIFIVNLERTSDMVALVIGENIYIQKLRHSSLVSLLRNPLFRALQIRFLIQNEYGLLSNQW